MCVGEVTKNTPVNILQGEAQDLINCAGEAAAVALEEEETKSLFVVDCISRVLFLEDQFEKELVAIKKEINQKNKDIILEGVLSLGEISSYGDGYLEFFNKTIVVSGFY